MSEEQLKELKEKAELWDSLSPILKTIHGSKFERPNGGVVTIQNISNASSHVVLLEEESKEMVCSEVLVKCSSCGNKTKVKYLKHDTL